MYRKDIDSYKGMAILAVIFFHLGYLKSGYLGVDLFFVINGFLVIPSIIKKISTGDFSYFGFLKKRLVRLYPLVIIATTICLLAGYVGMMPDNYENLAQAIVASNFMSENILSAITTHDYWNTVNDYNPLMHLWYIGILFEFYIIFPLILLLATKALPSKDKYETCKYTLLFLTLASAIYYLISKQEANSFYFIQCRFFEIGIGGIASYANSVKLFKNSNLAIWGKIQLSLLLMLIFILFSGLLTQKYETLGCNPRIIGYEADVANEGLLLPKPIMLFATVLLSAFIVPVRNENRFLAMPLLSTLGRMSYSLFIWHQLILAFMRYFIDIRFNALTMAVYVALVCGLSWLTYNYVVLLMR